MTFRRSIVLWMVLAAVLLATGAVGTAWAATPSNDTFANATVISALPFSQTLDTTQATADQTDDEVVTACGFGGFLTLNASVWYAYTPSTEQSVIVDLSGSTYQAGVAVVTGAPGSFSAVTCNVGAVAFDAHAGQTYYMDVAGVFSNGGTLHISVTQLAPPVLVVNSHGQFNSKTGAATISGTVSCPTGDQAQQISTNLVQRVGRGAVSGSASEPVASCGETPEPWSTTVQPSNGSKFTGGHATVDASLTYCAQSICGLHVTVNQNIALRPK